MTSIALRRLTYTQLLRIELKVASANTWNWHHSFTVLQNSKSQDPSGERLDDLSELVRFEFKTDYQRVLYLRLYCLFTVQFKTNFYCFLVVVCFEVTVNNQIEVLSWLYQIPCLLESADRSKFFNDILLKQFKIVFINFTFLGSYENHLDVEWLLERLHTILKIVSSQESKSCFVVVPTLIKVLSERTINSLQFGCVVLVAAQCLFVKSLFLNQLDCFHEMAFLFRFWKTLKSGLVVFKVKVDFKLHVVGWQSLQALQVGHVLFWVFLSLSRYQSDQVKVVSCQRNVE